MNLNIRVIPRASRSKIKESDGSLKAYLTKPAHDGLANAELIELLSGHFGVKRYRIKILKGEKSRSKIVSISDK
ncbi:MAG: DUF167 domain-containing protein [Candidatus Omnitrophota bacterium]|nr:DUF167 domain-containing protein [Candidatus Omnitrophota bacterium]